MPELAEWVPERLSRPPISGALRFEAATNAEYAVVMRLMAGETDVAP